jgi:hypothetical protein
MKALRTVLRRYLSVLFVASAAFVATPLATFAEQASRHVEVADFALSTDEGTLSLNATHASLKAILEQIGELLNIQVDAQVADDETVTDEFQDLPVGEALRRIAPNYAIITGQDDEEITKIVIMPKGEPADVTAETQQKPVSDRKARGGSEPFKFEFDPSAVMSRE